MCAAGWGGGGGGGAEAPFNVNMSPLFGENALNAGISYDRKVGRNNTQDSAAGSFGHLVSYPNGCGPALYLKISCMTFISCVMKWWTCQRARNPQIIKMGQKWVKSRSGGFGAK